MGSGEEDVYRLNRALKTEYERIMKEKDAERKPPKSLKDPMKSRAKSIRKGI